MSRGRLKEAVQETTQALIAIAITADTLYVATHKYATTEAFLLLSNAFFLVVGFYFGRAANGKG